MKVWSRTGSSTVGGVSANVIGSVLAVLAALVSIPITLQAYGQDRFGLIAIAQLVLGYLGLVDLGIGKATARQMAASLRSSDIDAARSVLVAATLSTALLGMIGSAAFICLSPFLLSFLHLPGYLMQEASSAAPMLGVLLPVHLLTVPLTGALEAQGRFKCVNALQAPTIALGQLLPALIAPFGATLVNAVLALGVARVLLLSGLLVACRRELWGVTPSMVQLRCSLSGLARIGGWLSVSNAISPLLVAADRFVIGSSLSIAAVGQYSIAFGIASRLWILPNSLTRVLVPLVGDSRDGSAPQLWRQALRYIKPASLMAAVVAAVMVALGPSGLRVWVGREVAEAAAIPLQLLAVGMFLNSVGHFAQAYLLGIGRPEVSARLHIIEAVAYAPTLVVLISIWGLSGAALAWALRVAIDSAALVYCSARIAGQVKPWNGWGPLLILSACSLSVGWLISSLDDTILMLTTTLALALSALTIGSYVTMNSHDRLGLAKLFLGAMSGVVPGKATSAQGK